MTDQLGEPHSGERPEAHLQRPPRSAWLVTRVLDAVADVIVTSGVDAVTFDRVAEHADVEVADLRTEFASIDGLLIRMLERDMAQMDSHLVTELSAVTGRDLLQHLEAVLRSYLQVLEERPAFVELWVRQRPPGPVSDFGRRHLAAVADLLAVYAIETGMADQDVPRLVPTLAMEIGDKIIQLAYAGDGEPDRRVLEEGVRLIHRYLKPYADQAAARLAR